METWTVKELIEELKCWDDNYKILINTGNMLTSITKIDLDYDEDFLVIK